ncbi:MAG: mycothiol system anti-sigma-R factor [Gemmatimonadota bacterium]|nr:mycothiol system anti-sigma-R factor [Gemmatimonadota bacterium]
MTDRRPLEPPDDWTCDEVIERVYEYLDGELTPDIDEAIRRHLARCRKCFPEFEHERVFLRFLERHAQIEKAPPALRRRIFQALLDEEARRHDP